MDFIYYILFLTIFLFILLFFFFIFIVIKSTKDYRKHQFIVNVISDQKQQITKSYEQVTITNQQTADDDPVKISRQDLGFEKLFSKGISGKDLIQQENPEIDLSEFKHLDDSRDKEARLKEELARLKEINNRQAGLLDELRDKNTDSQIILSAKEKPVDLDLDSKELKIDKLNDQIIEIQSAHNLLKLKAVQIQSAYDALERQSYFDIQSRDDKLSSDKTYIKALEGNTSILNDKLKVLAEEFVQAPAAKDLVKEKEKEILTLKGEIDALNRVFDDKVDLQRAFGQKEQEINDLNSQIASLGEKLTETQVDRVSFGFKVKEIYLLNEKIESLSAQLEAEVNLKETIDEKESAINDLNQRIEDLTKELEQVFVDKEKENELIDLSQKAKYLEEELRSSRIDQSVSSQKVIKSQELSQKLKKEVDILGEQVRSKEKEISELTVESSRAKEALASLHEGKMQLEQTVSEKETQISKLGLEIDNLCEEKSQAVKLNQKVYEQEEFNIDLSNQLARAKNDLTRLIREKEELEQRFSSKDTELKVLKEKTEEESRRLNLQIREKVTEKSDLADLVAKLKNDFSEQLKEKYRLEEDLALKEIYSSELLKKLDELKKELKLNKADREIIANQVREVEGLKNERETMFCQLKEKEDQQMLLAKKVAEVADFKQKLKSFSEELEAVRKAFASKEQELVEAKMREGLKAVELKKRLVIFKEQCLEYKISNFRLKDEHQEEIDKKEASIVKIISKLNEKNKELENQKDLRKKLPESFRSKREVESAPGSGIYSMWGKAIGEQEVDTVAKQKDEEIKNLRKEVNWPFKTSKNKPKESDMLKNRAEDRGALTLDIQKLKMDLVIIRAENEHLKDRLLGQ